MKPMKHFSRFAFLRHLPSHLSTLLLSATLGLSVLGSGDTIAAPKAQKQAARSTKAVSTKAAVAPCQNTPTPAVTAPAQVVAPTQAPAPSVEAAQKQVFAAVQATPKGSRPDPQSYISFAYHTRHIALFSEGASKIASYFPSGRLGHVSGTFVMPKREADRLIQAAAGDFRQLEVSLGLSPNDLGPRPVRIDIRSPKNLRLPSGNEAGANEFWVPGGLTSGGIPEAVIDPVEPADYQAEYLSGK